MLDKFKEYLGILPLTQVVKDRIEIVISLNAKIINDEVIDIFICDLKDEEGTKEYTSLWLFTDSHLMECKNFLSENNFDLVFYKNSIRYCSIKPIDFDFDSPTTKSSITINCSLLGALSCNIIATEDNCKKAFDIYKKYFVANIIKGPAG